MAEIVVGAVVTVLIEKLLSEKLLSSDLLMKFARSEGIDSHLKKWKNKLLLIQAVLAVAGHKEVTDNAVEIWLIDLQDLAYDIDDVLDDIATEVMKRKLNQEESHASTSKTSKVMKIIPACCTSFTPRNFIYGREISSKLDKITTRLDDLLEQKNSFGLNVNVGNSSRTYKPLEQTSLVDESEILGREEDKQALLEKLLGVEASSHRNVKIVSIVGLGGVGKTTLASILYNDEQVKNHFELRAWVCVSNGFDVFNVSMSIYQAVSREKGEFANLDLLHVALKEKLSNKRFLLVLDDVWKDDLNKWEGLKKPLVGAPGSKVIVTTRNTTVASVMNSVQPNNLRVLSDEIALSLFAQYALEEQNFDKHPSLKLIAQGIVKKCDGLPLALKALGRVLKRKGNKEVEWKELLNSDIWNLDDGSDILPALKLSYYDLPSHLKQLFAFCSLYPKDHQFDKNKLILKWMAQGFLSQPKGKNQPMESLGRKYFEDLLSRSFFQPVANDDESLYTMHDLMNDLATSVAGEFFFRLDENMDLNGRNEAYEKVRHFSFIVQQQEAEYKKFKELHRARTFLSVSIGWRNFNTLDNNVIAGFLPHLHSLRVLSLSNNSITEVPRSIGNLKHLRYLNFSETDIRQIPEEVSELYNLQSLLVRNCSELSSLPVSFAKLKNLRHLDMTCTWSLKKLPSGIDGLTSLHTLSKVVIEGGDGFKVSELKGLMDLQGALSIEGLEKVINPNEANDANLQQKKGLDDLELKWSDVLDDSRDPDIEYEVLEKLRAPHSNLKTLKIVRYGGMKLPNWLENPTSYDQLTELTLRDCKNCTHLPTLGHLTSLRQVTLYHCDSLESYCCPNSVERLEIFLCDSMASLSFSKLQEDLPSSSSSSSSSNLKILKVRQCKNIKSIGEKEVDNVGSSIMGSLREVDISYCDSLESYCCPNSVERLEIEHCDSMESLSFSKLEEDLPSSSSSLKFLSIEHCKNIKSIGEKEVANVGSSIMGFLREVTLSGCDSLESYCCPNSVESLKISMCSSMTSLSFSKLQEGCPSSSSSSNLKILEVRLCENIKSIGEKEVVNVGSSIMGSLRQVLLFFCDSLESYCCPTSVERLDIYNCSSMTSLSFSKLQEEELPSSSSSSNLKSLGVTNCKNIKSISQEHLQSLTSLEEMRITDCPSMEDSFPSCGLVWPPNLRRLSIGELKKAMSEWGLQNYPSSLVRLILRGKNSGVVSFGIMEDRNNNTTTSAACFLLPPSLTELRIREFEEVESVSEVLQHLPHLQYLEIRNCPKLKDVPESTSSLTVEVY